MLRIAPGWAWIISAVIWWSKLTITINFTTLLIFTVLSLTFVQNSLSYRRPQGFFYCLQLQALNFFFSQRTLQVQCRHKTTSESLRANILYKARRKTNRFCYDSHSARKSRWRFLFDDFFFRNQMRAYILFLREYLRFAVPGLQFRQRMNWMCFTEDSDVSRPSI